VNTQRESAHDDHAGPRGALASWVAWVSIAALYAVVLLLGSLARAVRGRRASATGPVAVLGAFYNPNWFVSHARPLALSGVDGVVVVTDTVPAQVEGVQVVVPPRWLVRLTTRNTARLLCFLGVGLKRRPSLFMGFHLAPAAAFAQLVGDLLGRPSCYQMTGGPIEIVGGGYQAENPVLRRLRGRSPLLERLALATARRFDLVVVRGSKARDYLVERGVPAGRVACITGSVDVSRLARDEDRHYDLLFLGRLEGIKRPLRFVQILAEVAAVRPEVRAVIVGDGPLRDSVREEAARLGVGARLEMTGKVADVERYLVRSRVFVLTSRFEGVSIALAEAMAAGVVPVVSDVGDLADLVEDGRNGFLVDPEDPQAFVRRVLELLGEPERCNRLSQAAREKALSRVSLEKVSELWREQLGRLVRIGGTTDTGTRVRYSGRSSA
jgi:glycosyltransferase involved in cell wall biosynthesis